MSEITSLDKSRWKEFKALRLEALKKEQIAFGSSYEEEKRLFADDWKKRIKNALFAFSKGKVIGMIRYVFEKRIKSNHIAYLYGFYVTEKFRNRGVGKRLMEAALSQIKQNKKIIKVKILVYSEQKIAINIYKKFGFKYVGTLKRELKVGDNFYDELIFEKFI